MTGTSAAVQATCRRSSYRPHRVAGRKAEYGRFSVLPRPEIYRTLRIKDSVKIDPASGSGRLGSGQQGQERGDISCNTEKTGTGTI